MSAVLTRNPLDMAFERARAEAVADTRDTSLEQVVAGQLADSGARTCVQIIGDALHAFAVRVATARAAGRTLDLQYYAWFGDVTGRLLTNEVLKAADRGVKVRLLLDDSNVLTADRQLAVLAAHPNIAVRLFNAAKWRKLGRLGLVLEFVLGGWHLNHRMHNKCWIADDRMVITGGRNIGDAYFDASHEVNFRDLDMLIAGEAAHQATGLFDAYWHSPLSRSINDILGLRAKRRQLRRLRRRLAGVVGSEEARPYLARVAESWQEILNEHRVLLPVDDVRIVADPPAKAEGRPVEGLASWITDELMEARERITLISPYFVPGETGVAHIEQLRRRGVEVTVITNSLAATDVVVVHSGYARYRPRLLQAGVRLFELKHTGHPEGGVFGSKGASLHTKALVVDDSRIFVGSFNLDPRSRTINTEMGAFAERRELAEQVRAEAARLTDPIRSYEVTLHGNRLAWTDDQGTVHAEPDASLGRRTMACIVRFLPIEAQL